MPANPKAGKALLRRLPMEERFGMAQFSHLLVADHAAYSTFRRQVGWLSLRAAAARSAEARMEGPKMVSRDLVPMPEECASLAGTGKPLQLAVGRETDATVRGSSPGAPVLQP